MHAPTHTHPHARSCASMRACTHPFTHMYTSKHTSHRLERLKCRWFNVNYKRSARSMYFFKFASLHVRFCRGAAANVNLHTTLLGVGGIIYSPYSMEPLKNLGLDLRELPSLQ